MEFARLATKWWRYYNRQGASVHSLKELKHRTTREPSREVAFLVLARADWNRTAPILGMCCCRRTWCNHIVLEFAAVHPVVLDDAAREIRGIGTGMLHSLICIADDIGASTVWGETTKNSAPFYEKVLGIPRVGDHFMITGRTMDRCRRQFEVLKNANAA